MVKCPSHPSQPPYVPRDGGDDYNEDDDDYDRDDHDEASTFFRKSLRIYLWFLS